MPALVLSPRQLELALEAFQCLRTTRLQPHHVGGREPNTIDAEELERMVHLVESLQRGPPRPAPWRSVKDLLTDEPDPRDEEDL